MLTLALETTATPSGVALLSDDDILEERIIEGGSRRGVGLAPAMQEILRAHGVAPKEVDLIGVSVGPGSFTGIRIGIAAAQGFALFSGSRLVGVPTIDALVAATPEGHTRLVVAIDAGRGRVYGAIHDLSAEPPRVESPPALLAAGELVAAIDGPAWVVGSATVRYPEAFARDGLTLAPPDAYPPKPSIIGRLARKVAATSPASASDRGGGGRHGGLEPIYLQPPEARTKAEREADRVARARGADRAGPAGRAARAAPESGEGGA